MTTTATVIQELIHRPIALGKKQSPLYISPELQQAMAVPQVSKMDHVMVDIETMGNESYSAIVSIGAVQFDINTGKTGDTFYETVDLQSSVDAGLIINASTVMWWMKQNERARLELVNSPSDNLANVLTKFGTWCPSTSQYWGNSARFDLGILQNAYNKIGKSIPWDFRKERCVRTLVSFAPEVYAAHNYEGTSHNALDDCYNQIAYCSKIWNTLKYRSDFKASLN